ncbi:hypothetical protein PHYSODRAFT_322970 [Phytophthora sojae]|uniref:Uncharacterized protein n=1 Tax=Phytophthora sojae (strain P6497) TaxID=1094619 RepID=G4YKW4_PHYSP|nr:hypothetical protein PHYSODRAFT_322970 [Phytophthora sojae]EGZ29456.1 hypothetical protein PHYSODRAFT_322970 [Phytophthora sojae]|eukprot:XP_009516731.1 hypothetical protein PHYSODRAFT_322970 [Phytophthora sojae]
MSSTTQLTDAYLLQSALKTESPIDVSKGKTISVVYDGNQGSYNSGLIQIDATSQLTGSRGFASLKEAYLTLPYAITAKSTGTASINSSTISRFACALKCNVANVIDSLTKPIKTVRYIDCFAQMFRRGGGTTNSSGVPAGQLNAPFDLNISGYKKNVKYVALIPFADTTAYHFVSSAGTPQYQSPFDSAPWTCMPGASIRNFQVTIGNSNVFDKSQEYDFESFKHEFSKLGAINRDLSQEKDVPQAIQVSGINGSATGMDLLALVVYKRELEIDRLTGEVARTD